MHICFISNEYPKPGIAHGGIGSFLKTLAPALILQGHQVTILGLGKNDFNNPEFDRGVKILRAVSSKVKGLSWWFNFKGLNEAIEKIHLSTPIDIIEGSELSFAFVKKLNGIKYVIRLHGGHHFFSEGENRKINKWKGFQEKKSFANADAFIAVSRYVMVHTSKFLSFHEKQIEVIYNPISLTKFNGKEYPKAKENSVVFVGTICEKKGIRQLIGAIDILREALPKVHLHVYGRDWKYPDGRSYLSWLLPQFKESLWKHVTIHGPVDQGMLPEIYGKAAICVFPSHVETLGLVAPEAMAMGKPVVFTRLGPGPEIIDHGVDGWLCDPYSAQDIADKIVLALDKNEDFPLIGEAAKKKVEMRFNPHHLLNQNIQFYKRSIEG